MFTTISRIGSGFGGTFNGFGDVAISGSTVAFIGGYTTGTGLGIFTGSGGPLTPIVQRGYLGPVQVGTFLSFSPPAISGSTVAFSGGYNSDADRGIFIWSGGALTKVIASGDPLFDSIATDVNIGFSALDPDGSIAFYYTLENGRKGVAIAVPPPPNLPPIAVATIAEDVDLDDGDPTVLVMSLNSVDAAVTLDGTASYDPDGHLPLSYEWFVDDSERPIGSGDTFPTSLSVGLHTVALRVIDSRGLAGIIAIVDVEVITFAAAINTLQDKVNSSEGFLWRPVIQKRVLNNKLEDALSAFESGNLLGPDGVCDELADFQNLIGQWTRNNPPRIDSALAAELTAMAETIRVSIGCP